MKKSLLLLCSAAIAIAASPEPDFRQVRWGMSQAEVMSAEPGQPEAAQSADGETIMSYEGVKIGGLEARLIYVFAGGKLVRARYLFEKLHEDPDVYIADFRQVEPVLRELHGKPAVDRLFWEDDDYQAEPKSYLEQDRATPADLLPSDPFIGKTLAAGHLTFHVEWQNERTIILHGLAAVDGRVLHQVEYSAR
jgi:hypothetical protein